MLKTWRNGEDAGIIKKIIDHNFRVLGSHLANNVLVLSKSERLSLTSDYLCDELIVYDKTDKCWYQYINKGWEVYDPTPPSVCTFDFTKDSWAGDEISIPYSKHLIDNPTVCLYIKNGFGYFEEVYGGINIDDNYNIVIFSDITFDGKVVVK